jgi:hypothetical protein
MKLPKMEIREVDADAIPPIMRNRGKWHVVAEDLLKRLECTSPSKALQIVFEDSRTAARASTGIRKAIDKRAGVGAVSIQRQDFILYVRRASAWKKPRLNVVVSGVRKEESA